MFFGDKCPIHNVELILVEHLETIRDGEDEYEIIVAEWVCGDCEYSYLLSIGALDDGEDSYDEPW